jgi:hypothetical protein
MAQDYEALAREFGGTVAPSKKAAGAPTPGGGMIISDPAAIRELQLKEEAAALDRARLGVTAASQNQNVATSTWRNLTPEEVAAEGLNPAQRYQKNEAGKIEPITGATVQPLSPNRVPQIQTALTGLTNIRALADKPLSVGRLAGGLGDAPIIGALVGQNRADLLGALSQIEGALIQDQLRELAKINPGGVSSLANSENEARRLASSIANLDPNQSQPEFLRGVQRAEEYFQRQLQQAGGELPPTNNEPIVTAPGTTRAAAMGAVTPGEPVMTDADMAAGRAIQEAWNATGKFEDVARVASQFGRTFGEQEAAFLRANEGKPVTINANATGTPTAAQEAVGEFVVTPTGERIAAGVVGGANASAFGLLDELAPVLGLDAGRVEMAKRYLQERQPVASLAGEISGSVIPGAALARGVNVGLAGTRLAGIAPLAGDAIAGGLAGAGEANENRLGGAALGATVGTAAGAAGRRVFGAGADGMGGDGLPPSPPQGGAGGPMGSMGGRASGGAAATPEDLVRVTRAQELPVPVQLANFQKSRAFEQQQRARELAKNNEVGGPIRKFLSDQQRAMAANFDSFLKTSGSQIWSSLEDQGVRVTQALERMAANDKARVRTLYKQAEKSADAETPVPLADAVEVAIDGEPIETTLVQFLNDQPKNVPSSGVTDAARQIALRLGIVGQNEAGDLVPKQPTVAAMEKFRREITGLADPAKPTTGRQEAILKQLTDAHTEPHATGAWAKARAARREVAQKYENVSTIAQLLGTKKNTAERVVAAEKVGERLMSDTTSAANLRALKTLLTAEGGDPQAWREVQGAAIERIRNAAFPKNADVDEYGQKVLSVSGLRNMVLGMDEKGKLDIIFDYETAKGLRTLADVAETVFKAPPGSVNFSNTSSAWVNALDMIINFVISGVPLPAGVANGVLKPVVNRSKNYQVRKEVKQLIGEPTQ